MSKILGDNTFRITDRISQAIQEETYNDASIALCMVLAFMIHTGRLAFGSKDRAVESVSNNLRALLQWIEQEEQKEEKKEQPVGIH